MTGLSDSQPAHAITRLTSSTTCFAELLPFKHLFLPVLFALSKGHQRLKFRTSDQVAWSAPKSSQSAGWAAAAGWAAETAVHRCQAQKAALEQADDLLDRVLGPCFTVGEG